ncbi:sugar ABC transporter substrate-binding protein [Actinomadura formosensis]|uniref:sugar ABC transporter substrate-binding protein n=1 Tax=Actinomadura formosensis TaxID=60706 RepID=UPI00082C96AE|nr:sugar ABC transporter substrate-binding protein [Actinomadura formosensis]
MAIAATALLSLVACAPPSSNSSSNGAAGGTKKYKIYLDLSYSGNAWSNAAANMIQALAKTPPYNQQVEFHKIISGADIAKQISDLQSMINSGADAIICYPLSPKALNGVVNQAAAKGVKMFFYDGTVTSPKAYNVSYITAGFGQNSAQYLVNKLGGKGKIFMNSGVSGTATDTIHNEAAKSVFAKYPGIKVVSQYWSNWDAVQSKTNTLKALAANPDVDGIWSQDGEYGVVQALQQAGHKLIPVTGEMSNGYRNQLLTLHDKGLVGVSSGSAPTVGAYAFKLAMELLTGRIKEGDLPHNTEFPLPWVPYDQVKVGDPLKPAAGGNTWPLDKVPPVFAAGIYYPDLVPEINYDSAINGNPVPGATIKPIDPTKIVKAPDVPEINSDTKTKPADLFKLNPEFVKPIDAP